MVRRTHSASAPKMTALSAPGGGLPVMLHAIDVEERGKQPTLGSKTAAPTVGGP
jgi:hypothetical protein